MKALLEALPGVRPSRWAWCCGGLIVLAIPITAAAALIANHGAVASCHGACLAIGKADSLYEGGRCLCRVPCMIPWTPVDSDSGKPCVECPRCAPCEEQTIHVEVLP